MDVAAVYFTQTGYRRKIAGVLTETIRADNMLSNGLLDTLWDQDIEKQLGVGKLQWDHKFSRLEF